MSYSRYRIEPRAWPRQTRSGSPPQRPADRAADAIRFEHVTQRGAVLVCGQHLPVRDEWHLRVLVNGKEVETRVSTSAYEDALDLLTSWRPG